MWIMDCHGLLTNSPGYSHLNPYFLRGSVIHQFVRNHCCLALLSLQIWGDTEQIEPSTPAHTATCQSYHVSAREGGSQAPPPPWNLIKDNLCPNCPGFSSVQLLDSWELSLSQLPAHFTLLSVLQEWVAIDRLEALSSSWILESLQEVLVVCFVATLLRYNLYSI